MRAYCEGERSGGGGLTVSLSEGWGVRGGGVT